MSISEPAMAIIEDRDSKILVVKCNCYMHELQLWDTGSGDIDISVWHYGTGVVKWPWSSRLKSIWKILTKGHAYGDCVILSKSQLAPIVEFLNTVAEKN